MSPFLCLDSTLYLLSKPSNYNVYITLALPLHKTPLNGPRVSPSHSVYVSYNHLLILMEFLLCAGTYVGTWNPIKKTDKFIPAGSLPSDEGKSKMIKRQTVLHEAKH